MSTAAQLLSLIVELRKVSEELALIIQSLTPQLHSRM